MVSQSISLGVIKIKKNGDNKTPKKSGWNGNCTFHFWISINGRYSFKPRKKPSYFPLNPGWLMTGSLFHGLWNNPKKNWVGNVITYITNQPFGFCQDEGRCHSSTHHPRNSLHPGHPSAPRVPPKVRSEPMAPLHQKYRFCFKLSK